MSPIRNVSLKWAGSQIACRIKPGWRPFCQDALMDAPSQSDVSVCRRGRWADGKLNIASPNGTQKVRCSGVQALESTGLRKRARERAKV